MAKVILIMRRDEEKLTPEERSAMAAALPNQDLEFRRTDACDYVEHDLICDKQKPAFVLLPRDKPIPSLAMEHGVPHVAVINGKLMELLPLVPQWKEFNP